MQSECRKEDRHRKAKTADADTEKKSEGENALHAATEICTERVLTQSGYRLKDQAEVPWSCDNSDFVA